MSSMLRTGERGVKGEGDRAPSELGALGLEWPSRSARTSRRSSSRTGFHRHRRPRHDGQADGSTSELGVAAGQRV